MPIIVIIEVAAAEPNNITSSLTRLSYINQDKDCALPSALKPIMGSNTLKLSSLMDNFRVFEPIIGFSAEGSAQSLSWLIYDNLVNEEVILFGSAAATSMMTIIGIAILLAPVLIRTWKEFKTAR